MVSKKPLGGTRSITGAYIHSGDITKYYRNSWAAARAVNLSEHKKPENDLMEITLEDTLIGVTKGTDFIDESGDGLCHIYPPICINCRLARTICSHICNG